LINIPCLKGKTSNFPKVTQANILLNCYIVFTYFTKEVFIVQASSFQQTLSNHFVLKFNKKIKRKLSEISLLAVAHQHEWLSSQMRTLTKKKDDNKM